MSQDVKKGPSAALIIESSQNYFNQRGLIYLPTKKFSMGKVWGKTFFRCEKSKLLKCPLLPPPLRPKYKQTNLQILYHISTKKIAHGLFHIFNKLRSIVSQCKVYYTLVPKDEDIQREYTE